MPKKPPSQLVHKTLRLPQDLLDAAKAAADEAGMSLADYHRFALRQAIDRQSAAAELAGVEDRMAAQLTKLHRRFTQLFQAQQFQFAVLDQFMKMALALEPELVDDAARAAVRATGLRRHQQLMATVPDALAGPMSRMLQAFIRGERETAEIPAV